MLKKVFIIFVGIIAFTLYFLPGFVDKSMNPVTPHDDFKVSEKAKNLHNSLIIGDWHADTFLWNRDIKKIYSYGHVDIPRLNDGNVALQMFTTVTKSPSGQNYERNDSDAFDNITLLAVIQLWPIKTWFSLKERALFQADKIKRLAKESPDSFFIINSKNDLSIFLERRYTNKKLVGALIGTEGSHALDGEIGNIEVLYENGFRMMSLHHFFDNKLGGSLHGTSAAGLTEFGKEALLEMERLNIIIDVSHSSSQVVKDVLENTSSPLVVSHTGFKGHCDSPRNISDELMKKIANRGGLIAVGFWDAAICDNTPKVVAEAILYGINLIGENHVSLGSDFDGTIEPGFDTSELVAITHELLELGLTDEQIRKVMGGNMLNFLQENLPKI